jgi:hypothetical protein
LAGGYCFYCNSIEGGLNDLRWANFYRIKPAQDFLQKQEEKAVVVSSGYIPMEMPDLFGQKYFFLAEKDSSFRSLLLLLKKSGIRTIIYINDENESPGLPNHLKDDSLALLKKGIYYFAKYTLEP